METREIKSLMLLSVFSMEESIMHAHVSSALEIPSEGLFVSGVGTCPVSHQ